MLKIIVIGSPGAGKSTFARKLRDATEISLYYLDMLWHKPDQTNIRREELDEEFKQWIIDFSKDQLPQIYELLEKYRENRNVVIFKSREEAEEYMKMILSS